MSRAELLRRHAHECVLRARSLADRVDPADPATRGYVKESDVEVICARVLLELAQVEEEEDCCGD